MQLTKKGKCFLVVKANLRRVVFEGSSSWLSKTLAFIQRPLSRFHPILFPALPLTRLDWGLLLSTIFIDFICSYFHGFKKGREIKKKKSINKSSQKSEIPRVILCRVVWIHSLPISEAPSSTCAHPQLVWISWRMLLFSFNLIFSKFCLFWFPKKKKTTFFEP